MLTNTTHVEVIASTRDEAIVKIRQFAGLEDGDFIDIIKIEEII